MQNSASTTTAALHTKNKVIKMTKSTLKTISQKTYFESLARRLDAEMREYINSIDLGTFSPELIYYCFEEILDNFMKAEFNRVDCDYKDEVAQEFYEMIACDIRCDFEHELRELIID